MEKEIKLFTDGLVQQGEHEFTRLVGGFGEDKPVISDLQIAQMLEYKNGVKQVRETINRNKESFDIGVHLLDINQRSAQNATLKETLVSLGYSKQSLTQAKNIYILSKAGFLLYLKFAEGEKAVEIYKDFMEDYFRTKAQNKEMTNAIQAEIEILEQQKATALGRAVMASSLEDKIKYLEEVEAINKRLESLAKTLAVEELKKTLEPKLQLADLLTNTDQCYDMNAFSKVIGNENLGRNKLFKWMRQQEILRPNNEPYQQYMKYFKVIFTTNHGHVNSKTLIRPSGIEYIVKRLIKDGKVIVKSVDEILKDLESSNADIKL